MNTFKNHFNTSLDQFRKEAIEEVEKSLSDIKEEIKKVIKEPFNLKLIGSVTSPDKFTEDSDVDLGVYISSDKYPDGVVEELSEIIQQLFLKIPFSFGVLNTIVINNGI